MVVEGAENERVGGDVFSRVWRGRAAGHASTRSYPPRTPRSGPGGAQGGRGRFALELEASCLSLTETRGLVFSKILPSRATFSKILLTVQKSADRKTRAGKNEKVWFG